MGAQEGSEEEFKKEKQQAVQYKYILYCNIKNIVY